jgi:glutamyl-tRNA synthetase/glutamyl-Q tRNA(Asp) synthetase
LLRGHGDITTRFAPAPTGRLHLGHVVNAVYVWGLARAFGGRVLLRIEDHDRQRSRPHFEAAILDDLDWLGFAPDMLPTTAFREGFCEGRQSDRTPFYTAALERLRSAGLVYACGCSRSTIEAASPGQGAEAPYPGTCRDKGLAFGDGLGLRVRLEPTDESFDDLGHGPMTQRPAEQCGDLLIRDRQGNWTYQFAVVVDDAAQGVTLVVRGDDLLASTGRQIQLARLLGRGTPPRFFHHPLVMKTPMQKLSKSDRDTGVGDLRRQGWTSPAIIGRAAHLAGLLDRDEPLAAGRIAGLALWSKLTV